MESTPNRTRLYLSVFILNMVYLACGATFAWSSPVLLKLQLSASEGSTVASMLSLGSILGPFVCGMLLDVLGRKATVGLGMSLILISQLILTLAVDSILLLSLGRFMAGIFIGMALSSLPMYIAEISEDSVRGFLNTLSQISSCSGMLLVYAVGPFVSYAVLHYILLGVCTVFFLLFPLLPNSPHFLVLKNRVNEARDSLIWLRGNRSVSAVEKELQLIQSTVRQNQADKGTVKDLFATIGNRRALTICTVLLAGQQLAGGSIITFYAETIFRMTGSTLSSSTCSIILGLIMTASGFICPAIVKNFGYKKPLMASLSGMALGMVSLGLYFLLKFNHFEVERLSWMPLLSVVTYIVSFNSGLANIPWALSGEMFPSNVKPYATTLVTSISGTFAYFTTKFFPDLILLLGLDFLFLTCSFFCFLAFVFIFLVVQDTCGLSFVEIQEILNGRRRKDVLQRLAVRDIEDCKL